MSKPTCSNVLNDSACDYWKNMPPDLDTGEISEDGSCCVSPSKTKRYSDDPVCKSCAVGGRAFPKDYTVRQIAGQASLLT